MNGTIESKPPSSWWRRQGPWLLGAALLGAYAFYMPYRESLNHYAIFHPIRPIEVAKGASADYEGARWRLLNITQRDQRDLREDAMILVARFELIADEGTSAKNLNRCKSRISDARGRYWEVAPFSGLRVKSELPDSCGSGRGPNFTTIEPEPGKPWLFEQAYLVPRGLDPKTLRPEIYMFSMEQRRPGDYLRFMP
ncbi:hypothetical protein [Dokdonella sp.]|uniref:hypothetical protein n=1 Tax=Dokdonella sp. TaxID=2291710 RepID=UPI001B1596AF|nr:hypothetical protein [Dokdonella sp.]MBO9664812.1 hypothetical protein [Dokdonella sp.]